jgi:hypothetical protein
MIETERPLVEEKKSRLLLKKKLVIISKWHNTVASSNKLIIIRFIINRSLRTGSNQNIHQGRFLFQNNQVHSEKIAFYFSKIKRNKKLKIIN